MRHKPAQVRDEWLVNATSDGGDIQLDSEAWFAWLEAPGTRSFAYALFDPQQGWIEGLMTVRKERRERGGWYWSVYRRQGERLRRVYLGAARQLTSERLSRVAEQLREEAAEHTAKARAEA